MRFIFGFIVGVLVLVGAGVAYMYSGAYNVAASVPHTAVGKWVFHTTMENSVRAHAQGVNAPQLTDQMAFAGAAHFDEDCAMCHGAPGVKPKEVAKGMRPEPPDLGKVGKEMTTGQIFWIVKHGIKMTGMPAWGEIDDDADLWKVVAFVQRLANISPEQYQQLVHAKGGEQGGLGKAGSPG